MALAEKIWKRVSVHEMVLAWCRAERDTRIAKAVAPNDMPLVNQLLDSADTENPQENHLRLHCLYTIRYPLLAEIPPDTEWYEVRDLTDAELTELHVITRGGGGWDDPNPDPAQRDKNELLCVAKRESQATRKAARC